LATCADLVAAVNSLTSKLEVDDPDNSGSKLSVAALLLQIRKGLSYKVSISDESGGPPTDKTITAGESLHRTSSSLEQRLPHRDMWNEYFAQNLAYLQYLSDSVGERLAQLTSTMAANPTIPDSGITDTTELDLSNDHDTLEKG